MTSMIINIFEDNFIEQCIQSSFLEIKCIIGSSTLFFSLIFLISNIIALIKLAYYYGKINFETNLILFSVIEILIIQLVIITSYEILIEFFILIQFFLITLIIRKFVILSKQTIQYFRKNGLFIFLNTTNILLFIVYTMFLLKNNKEDTYSIILIHSLFYALSSIILTVYSNLLVKLIKKLKKYEIKTSSQSTIDSSNEKINPITVMNYDSIDNDLFNNVNKDCIFYLMRKKQIRPLYKINIICSFLEFALILSILIIPNKHFEQSQFKIIPYSLLGYLILYLYLFICLFNVSANFLCFFWIVRREYKKNNGTNINNKRKTNKAILDNRYIKRTTINMKNEEPEQINEFIENENNKNDPKKYEKSIYMSSFTDISIDKQDDDFAKSLNNKVDNNNINIEEKEYENFNNFDDKDNKENINKELLEPLNNNLIDRESIQLNMDTKCGINRLSTYSTLKNDENN